ncbi:VTT domain-containing protein [Rhodocytophaga rosea]|uniref:VTT domain-containing protein n=1 Tax=Rhodocytophaga rosea TaxID=2704465 RepID=A0A6C0GHL0_9BACT|nr:VTT domain-containing protein [Rhodocytophaga rosea]QHT67488.1 VTT domain-containing protein [Rhodocytophaga rosea]
MNRYIYIFIFICLFTVLTFVVFETSGYSFEALLTNNSSKSWLALLSLLLLATDVLLPIPSSFIMVSNGALFNFLPGGLLSLAGGLLSCTLGYFIGLRAKGLINKYIPSPQQAQARAFLEKYGALAIIASRPIPVLAEAVAIMSGTLKWRFQKMLVYSLIGLVPICFIYSFTGAYSTSFDNAWLALLFNIGIALLLWFFTRGDKVPSKR